MIGNKGCPECHLTCRWALDDMHPGDGLRCADLSSYLSMLGTDTSLFRLGAAEQWLVRGSLKAQQLY